MTTHAPNNGASEAIRYGKLNRTQPIAPFHFPTTSGPTAHIASVNAQSHIYSHTLMPPPILNEGVNVYSGVTDNP